MPTNFNTLIRLQPISTSARGNSPLWSRARGEYLAELTEDADDKMLARFGSLRTCLLMPARSTLQGSASFTALSRLDPTLKVADDFSAVIAICLGASAKAIALVWRSLMLIITLASTHDALPKVLDMLEELSLSLPRLRCYEESYLWSPVP